MTTETFTTTNRANVSFFRILLFFHCWAQNCMSSSSYHCLVLVWSQLLFTILSYENRKIILILIPFLIHSQNISSKLQIEQVRFYHNCCTISCTRPWLLPNDLKSFSCKFLPQCYSKSFRSAHYSPNMDNSSLGIYFLDCSYLVPCLHMLCRRKKSVLQNLDIVLPPELIRG